MNDDNEQDGKSGMWLEVGFLAFLLCLLGALLMAGAA